MKYETFETILTSVRNQCKADQEREEHLGRAFNDMSTVFIENDIIDEVVEAVLNDFNAEEWMWDYAWDFITPTSLFIEIDDYKILPTLWNYYLILCDRLDECNQLFQDEEIIEE